MDSLQLPSPVHTLGSSLASPVNTLASSQASPVNTMALPSPAQPSPPVSSPAGPGEEPGEQEEEEEEDMSKEQEDGSSPKVSGKAGLLASVVGGPLQAAMAELALMDGDTPRAPGALLPAPCFSAPCSQTCPTLPAPCSLLPSPDKARSMLPTSDFEEEWRSESEDGEAGEQIVQVVFN